VSKYGILAGVVAVLAAGWTGGWYYLTGQAETLMDAELAKLKARGVTVTCPERSIGGFPFRFEVRCAAPTVAVERTGMTAKVTALRAVALLYNPTHAIIELDGPLEATQSQGGTVTATWATLQASARLADSWTVRASLAAKTLDAKASSADGKTVRLVAETAEAHVRPVEVGANRFDIDIQSLFLKLQTEIDGAPVGPPTADVSVDLTARGWPLTRGGAPFKTWAANGGSLEIKGVKITAGELDANASGSLASDPAGLLTGAVAVSAAGLEKVATDPASLGLPRGAAAAIGALMIMAPKETVDGVPRRRVDIKLDQGAVRIGPIKAGSVPPLF
jgi:hypothetical protein